jgi:hypothetical protein
MGGGDGQDLTGSRRRTLVDSCIHGNEPLSFLICYVIIEQLSYWWLQGPSPMELVTSSPARIQRFFTLNALAPTTLHLY